MTTKQYKDALDRAWDAGFLAAATAANPDGQISGVAMSNRFFQDKRQYIEREVAKLIDALVV